MSGVRPFAVLHRTRARRGLTGGLALGLLTATTACTAPSPASDDAAEPEVRIEARYPATLIYALDGATGLSRHDEGYHDWLVPRGPDPDWLRAYRRAREQLQGQRDDGDGYHEPFLSASYAATDINDLRRRLRAVVPDELLVDVLVAVREADQLLRPHWFEHRVDLERARLELTELVCSDAAQACLDELRRACSLPPYHRLDFRVVLVAKPDSTHTYAHQQGPCLVLEWPRRRDTRRILGVVFHEIAHLAVHHSPGVDALEARLYQHGTRAVIAGNYWNEAFATAFGNGWTARRLDPQFDSTDPLYDNPAIDSIARHLDISWHRGEIPKLGVPFAEAMLGALSQTWPKERWRLADVVFRFAAFSEDREALRSFVDSSHTAWSVARTPLPDDVSVPANIPAGVTRVFLLERATLRDRPDLPAVLGIKVSDAYTRLSTATSSWHLRVDERGSPVLTLIARDADSLREAAEQFRPHRRLPEPGWFAP